MCSRKINEKPFNIGLRDETFILQIVDNNIIKTTSSKKKKKTFHTFDNELNI